MARDDLSASQLLAELRSSEYDWMSEYGRDIRIEIEDADPEETRFNVIYADWDGHEWTVPIVYLDGEFAIDIGDCGMNDLTPAAYWAYLFVSGCGEVRRLRAAAARAKELLRIEAERTERLTATIREACDYGISDVGPDSGRITARAITILSQAAGVEEQGDG